MCWITPTAITELFSLEVQQGPLTVRLVFLCMALQSAWCFLQLANGMVVKKLSQGWV